MEFWESHAAQIVSFGKISLYSFGAEAGTRAPNSTLRLPTLGVSLLRLAEVHKY